MAQGALFWKDLLSWVSLHCDLGHNREHFFLCGIIKPGIDYSQTAKDITKEKIVVVDSLYIQGFFTPSLTQ